MPCSKHRHWDLASGANNKRIPSSKSKYVSCIRIWTQELIVRLLQSEILRLVYKLSSDVLKGGTSVVPQMPSCKCHLPKLKPCPPKSGVLKDIPSPSPVIWIIPISATSHLLFLLCHIQIKIIKWQKVNAMTGRHSYSMAPRLAIVKRRPKAWVVLQRECISWPGWAR